MTTLRRNHRFLTAAIPASLFLASTALLRPEDIEPGKDGIPTDAARNAPACGVCHAQSGDRPHVLSVPTRRVLAAGEAISITTTATGGIVASKDPGAGGFLTEVTAGTLSEGPNTSLGSSGMTISHHRSEQTNGRTWTYGYQAPQGPGLVELFTVALTGNAGNGPGGDSWAFAGFDNTATIGTPVRLYVLAPGVENMGPGCPDGFGNFAVLGSSTAPTIGNASFGCEVHGASPAALAVLYASINSPGFSPLDLGTVGLPGCFAYVETAVPVVAVTTSAGVAERGEGSGPLPLPIPVNPSLVGLAVDLQAAYIDPSATSIGRYAPVTVTNGLRIVLQ